MKTKHVLLATLFLMYGLFTTTKACTTAVIAAKNSASGKSMIWKLRDTDNLKNAMRYFDDGKYTFLGLVNSNDTLGKHVWGGSNNAGFAIMNSASFNVNENDTTQLKDQEGVFMKLALQTCASLEEFEALLNNYPKPSGQASHYGVIDANGGAAFYEVNNWTWTKFDANDLNVAPNGYVIRTNFSETGTPDVGYGFIRRETAEKVFAKALENNKLDYRTVLQRFSRCTYHPVFDVNYRAKFENGDNESPFISSDDLIARHGTSSAIVVEGVKSGESPALTTIWTQIGFPHTTISVPMWVEGSENFPTLLAYDAELGNSPLNEMALELKSKCYPLTRSDGHHYLKFDELINQYNNGLLQRIERVEKEIFDKTDELLSKWAGKAPSAADIGSFYNWVGDKVISFYDSVEK